MTIHPRALDYPQSLLSGVIPDEAELTAGQRVEPGRSCGLFTDTTLCIGCKACEVACKEWNALPADDLGLRGTSYDNTGDLSATTWRHVHFIEHIAENGERATEMPPFQNVRRGARRRSRSLCSPRRIPVAPRAAARRQHLGKAAQRLFSLHRKGAAVSSDCCRAAVAALDRALDDRPDKIYHDLAEVVRCLVLLRTELTACNGVLSTVIGGEYPLAGLRRDRLHKDRNELASLFDEA